MKKRLTKDDLQARRLALLGVVDKSRMAFHHRAELARFVEELHALALRGSRRRSWPLELLWWVLPGVVLLALVLLHGAGLL